MGEGDAPSRVTFKGLLDLPRWSQTCPRGHFHRTRAEERPGNCPTCNAPFPIVDDSRYGGKRTSGSGALHTQGDGRQRNRARA